MADDDDTREVHVNGTSPAPEPPVTADTSIKDGNTTVNYDTHGGKGAATAVEHIETTTESTKHRRQGTDPEAQEMVISSLKSQIQDLFSQVNELNNKLVKSYDRVSDLEDDIHVASANLRQSSIRISHLELERTQHLAALNTGLLVEKAHVTAELNRLMEKATEEAAQRGQAESARVAIEKDLDDLSASLFGQANTMVAEARYAQHLSERKVEDAERALRDAEEMVGLMQVQMQTMQEDKDQAQQQMTEMQAVMGKGKYREREQRSADLVRQVRLLSSHVPYQEFLLFVAHLRSLHTTSPIPPAMATLLPLPFLARLTTEEAEPTVRLDLAPALNWLSRRSVLSAIHSGQLTIEPIPVSALFSEATVYSSPTTIAGVNPSNDSVSCALCGAVIIASTDHSQRRRPPSLTSISGVRSSFSGSFFRKTSTITNSRPPSPTSAATLLPVSTSSSQSRANQHPQQIFVFRVASAPSTTSSISSALPLPSIAKSLSQGASPSPGASFSGNASPVVSSSPNNQPMTIYPLCTSGWCLGRLRSACQLWSFIRTGIVDRIWEEEVPVVPVTPTSTTPASGAASSPSSSATPDKPPIPPRRRGLWGGIASAFGDRASSWTGEAVEKKAAAAPSTPATPVTPPPLPPRKDTRRLPPPPTLAKEASPPGPEPESEVTTVVHPSTPPTRSSGPPLPPRSGKRSPTSVPNGDSREHAEGAVPTESAPSSPVRVVFDMTHPQSPMRPKEKALPAESTVQEGTEPLVTSNGPSVPPALTPIAGNSEAAGPNGAAVKASEIPLPESRPTSPEALGTPARVASPSIAGMVANGVGSTPPPLPRRAAARRPVPPPPGGAISTSTSGDVGSRPGTPVKKMEDRIVVDGKTEKDRQDKVEGKETVLEDHKESSQSPEHKAAESESDDEFVDAVGGVTSPDSLSTPAVEVSSDPIADVPDKITVANPGSVPKSAEETPERRQSIDTLKEVPKPLEAGEKPPEAPLLTVTPKDLEPSLTTDTTLGGIEKHGDSPVDDSDANAQEDGRDSKEVYVGDTTWEERTWKEIVRLKEDMFWARVGGWRP